MVFRGGILAHNSKHALFERSHAFFLILGEKSRGFSYWTVLAKLGHGLQSNALSLSSAVRSEFSLSLEEIISRFA